MNTFSYYDHVLDTAVLLGALPARVAAISDDLDRYFAAARGNDDVAPLEMTKWFDTNYHYLVPEIGTDTRFALNPAKLLAELEEARAQGIPARPVIVGPVTFLLLSKAVGGAGAPIERLDELVPVYAELLELLADERRRLGAARRARAGHRHPAQRGRARRTRLRALGALEHAARAVRRHLLR